MRTPDVKKGAVLPLMCENPNVMACVKLGAKYLGARRFAALPSNGRASKIVYAGRSRATVYGARQLLRKEWGTVKEHTVDGTDMPVLRDESEAVYDSIRARCVHGVEAGRNPEDLMGYRMLPWPHRTLPF